MLYTLLALFLGCTGYAAGRLHQWYRTGIDRDEAYREGYDTATRSTFSMAARIIGPRRDKTGIRASASVHAAGTRSGTPLPGTAAQRPSAAKAGRSTTPPASRASAAQPPSAGEVARSPTPAVPALPPPVETAFPAPPAFEFPALPAPARLDVEVWSAIGTPPAEAAPATSEQSSPAPPALEEADAPKRPRRGRHLVPDELVRAVTYRLAPDRVARAKVRQAKRAPEVASEDGLAPRPGSGSGDGDGRLPGPGSADEDAPASHPASEGRPSPRRSLPKPRAS